jgi:hypothetical protein
LPRYQHFRPHLDNDFAHRDRLVDRRIAALVSIDLPLTRRLCEP